MGTAPPGGRTPWPLVLRGGIIREPGAAKRPTPVVPAKRRFAMWIFLIIVLVVIGLIAYTARTAHHDPVSAAWLQQRADLLAPDVAATVLVDPSPTVLAFAARTRGGQPVIVMYSGLLRAIGPDLPALEFALARELAHLRRDDTAVTTVPRALADPARVAQRPLRGWDELAPAEEGGGSDGLGAAAVQILERERQQAGEEALAMLRAAGREVAGVPVVAGGAKGWDLLGHQQN